MEEKYKAFQAYQFENNEAFRRYIDGIEPPPALSRIPFYKKKFYKLKVDPEFDLNYDPAAPTAQEPKQDTKPPPPPESKPEPREESKSEPQPEQKSESAGRSQSPQGASRQTMPWSTKLQMMLYFVFICTLPVGIVCRSLYHGIPLCLAFLIGTLKNCGRPRLAKEFWQDLFRDDHFHNLISTVVCIMSFSSTVIIWFPLVLRAVLFLAESVHFLARRGSKLAQIVDKVGAPIASRREQLLVFKADLEIYSGFYLIGVLFLGWVSLILPLFYWQIMQIRYMLNAYTRAALDTLAYQMDMLIANPSCPTLFKWLLQGLRKAGSYMAKMAQPEAQQPAAQAQQSSSSSWCTTF